MTSDSEDPTLDVSGHKELHVEPPTELGQESDDDGSVPPPRPAELGENPVPAKTARIVVSVVLIVLLLALGAGGFLALASMKKGPGRAATPPPRTAVRVRPAERTSHQETIHGYGRARALRSSTIAAELSASVKEIAAELEAGNAVAKDVVLLRLDDRDARAARDGAQARLLSAKADVQRLEREAETLVAQLAVAKEEWDAAQRELEREKQGLADGSSTASAVDNRSMQANVRRAQIVNLEGRQRTTASQSEAAAASVTAAQAELQKALDNLDRTEVRAPFAGVIQARHVGQGARVAPGTPLFELLDPSEVEIPVALPASRYSEVRLGAVVQLRLAEGGEPVATTSIARISPTVDTASRTFSAYVLLRGPDATSRPVVPPGAFVVATVTGRKYDDVFVVPRAAFVAGSVFVAEPDTGDEALVRAIRPELTATLMDVILVRAGLEVGDRIVLTNVEQIADGSRVRLVREKATTEEESGE